MYVLRHHGACDPECNGNPVLIDDSMLELLKEKWSDWNEDENGEITTTGDDKWKAERKTARITPVVESDAALTTEQRETFLAYDAVQKIDPHTPFKVRAVPVYDGIPEQIVQDRERVIEELETKGMPWMGVAAFVMATGKVSNVCFSEVDGSITGFDHDLMTQFIFEVAD